jgi:hypothetical protein
MLRFWVGARCLITFGGQMACMPVGNNINDKITTPFSTISPVQRGFVT